MVPRVVSQEWNIYAGESLLAGIHMSQNKTLSTYHSDSSISCFLHIRGRYVTSIDYNKSSLKLHTTAIPYYVAYNLPIPIVACNGSRQFYYFKKIETTDMHAFASISIHN